MSGTVIKRCSCKSEYQDEKYGMGLRVHNKRDKKGGESCTVCGVVKQGSSDAGKKPKGKNR